MQREVFYNIDLLIEMSGNTKSIDDLNTELITLKNNIKNKQEQIEDLKSIMTDARYFNASNELVDKNIEISLKNKLTRLKRKLKEMENNSTKIKEREESLHNEIKSLKETLKKNKEYILVLEEKSKTANVNNYYKELLQKENKNNAELINLLDNKEKEYKDVLKELELTNQAIKEINAKIENENNRLNDILDNLKNPNAYIDEDLKKNDTEKLEQFQKELSELEKKELTILTNAAMIGSDAKELVADNKIKDALAKIRELVTIVKTCPYMDITNRSILDEELEKKENARIELSNLMDSKNYDGINSIALKNRIEYIELELKNKDVEIKNLEAKRNDLDEFINANLGKNIDLLEQESLNLTNTISEYKALQKEKDKFSKKDASLLMAITKKEKELKLINDILENYKKELIRKLKRTNEITKLIEELQKDNKSQEDELSLLKNISDLEFKTKDLMEEEKDKEELRKLNDEIKALKKRQNYDRTPDEIYDQIEMLLASFKETTETLLRSERNKAKNLEIDSLFENKEEIPSNRIKVIEMIPATTIKKKMEEF